MTDPKRASVYARVSYYDKKGDSIESQIETCRQYADENGYQVVAELADHNISGADMKAPDLERALELARQGHFDVLVTRELDRFARSLTKQLLKEYEFREAGVGVEYVLGDYDDSLEGQLVKNVRAVIAEFSRGKIAERMARGRRRSAERGNVLLARNPPLGYQLAESTDGNRIRRSLEIDDEEAELVRQIFSWYMYGEPETNTLPMSMRKITKHLNELKLPTKWDRSGRGQRRKSEPGQWFSATVRRILANETYAGTWTFREAGADIPVEVPAIISPALFKRAQRKRSLGQVRSPRNAKHPYLLRGHVLCASCGYRIHTITLPKRSGGTYGYYRCPGAKTNEPEIIRKCEGCFRIDYVDPPVWTALAEHLTDEEKLRHILEGEHNDEQLQHLRQQIAIVGQRTSELKAEMRDLFRFRPHVEGEHALSAFLGEQRRINDEIARQDQRDDELEAQLANTEERLKRVHDLQSLIAIISDGIRDATEFAQKRQLIEVLDVTVRLESDGDDQRAHIELEGEYLTTVDLPPTQRHKRRA